ncbi:hypothetical protein [Pectobacterium phage Wc4-1]|uniref:Uncharacterized protein n=1 Tax=Pectobacterium phage Wc4 TaxID=2652428 RepID=A0A5P8D6Z5_9CAUD|nr:hypothetical protein [Pectobacterium phage Wc4]QFP93935.1 hypothetical protein [Pectobacterium phage Wc4-1]
MKKPLMERFDDLLSHLNAEENDMALELRADLEVMITQANADRAWGEALVEAGIDEWEGIERASSFLTNKP